MMKEKMGRNWNKAVRFFAFALLLFGVGQQKAYAEVWGKVDFGPTYAHVDVLNFNRTVKRLDLLAYKADATIIVKDGWCLKPGLLYGTNRGELLTTSLGIGHCFPVLDKLIVTPVVGFGYSFMRTTFMRSHLGFKLLFKERFYSYSPYLGLELHYRIASNFRVSGQVQYWWSRTYTNIKRLIEGKDYIKKDHTSGPSYAAMVEYDLAENVSINAGAAYNQSLSQEKHGIRGYGAKVGCAYWF